MSSSIELINLKIAIHSFVEEGGTDAQAMHLLELCAHLEYPPPAVLHPYILKATKAWGETKGNKTPYKATPTKWAALIERVHFYRCAGKGATLSQALDEVEKELFLPEPKSHKMRDSLRRNYEKPEYQSIKQAVEQIHGPPL